MALNLGLRGRRHFLNWAFEALCTLLAFTKCSSPASGIIAVTCCEGLELMTILIRSSTSSGSVHSCHTEIYWKSFDWAWRPSWRIPG